jgi:predicted acetylornithine/succinylornithine family transaminase
LDTAAFLDRAKSVLIGNYARLPVVMTRGQGARLWDSTGKQYIDLFAGFGGGILGHAHPALVESITQQANKLWHVGNTFHSEPQVELAERLNKFAFRGQAFFCHSGLESNEAAVKLARLRGAQQNPRRWKVVSFHRSFHGRSLAMIAATGNPAVKAGFEPAVPGFTQIDLGDLEALGAVADNETAAVIVEPIQGEGGINPIPLDFAIELRRLCDQRQITLIFDEVWTGCGRTGKWFGHQHFVDASGKAVLPDILTLGKAIGGGMPVGVMFARPELAALMTPGKHGCTIGGNPIGMSVARTIFDVIERENLLAHAAALGEKATARLRGNARLMAKATAVRGKGLFLGIELKEPPTKLVERALDHGVIINVTGQKIIRIAPPINVSEEEFFRGLDAMIEAVCE